MEVKTITLDGFFRIFTSCPQDTKTFILDTRSQKEFQKQHVMQAYSIRLAASGKALLVHDWPPFMPSYSWNTGPVGMHTTSWLHPVQDYSKNSYDVKWCEGCWWDKNVVLYGDAGFRKDHPVVAFLAKDGHAKGLAILKEGCAPCTTPAAAVQPSCMHARHCCCIAKASHAQCSLCACRFEGFQKAYPFLCTASVKNNATKRYPGEIVPKVLYLGDWQHAEAAERLDELNIRR